MSALRCWIDHLTCLEGEKEKRVGNRETEGQKCVGEAIGGKEGSEKTWDTCGFLHTLIHHERAEK